jgi:hypothetical protein
MKSTSHGARHYTVLSEGIKKSEFGHFVSLPAILHSYISYSSAIRKQILLSITLSPVWTKYRRPLYDQPRNIVAYKHSSWQATRKTNALLISFVIYYSLFHKNYKLISLRQNTEVSKLDTKGKSCPQNTPLVSIVVLKGTESIAEKLIPKICQHFVIKTE